MIELLINSVTTMQVLKLRFSSKKTCVSILLFTLLALLITVGLSFVVGMELMPNVDQSKLS